MAYIIDKLELEPCEIGSVDFVGTIDTNPNPLATANVHIEIHEEQTAETRPEGCRNI